ncbi:MAG: hypothetical protein QW101_02545 [Ignisphaera sp.]|uniref:Thioredoxin domain-containing protein n=1 Tax=Ignisphaera aggregans TaxID=334771 RepID=A0A7J3MWS6_9CREN
MSDSSSTLKIVNETSQNGIYLYDPKNSVWIFLRSDGDSYKPDKKGIYVLYFDNAKCSACRKYDNIWFPFVQNNANTKNNLYFVVILCNWFARDCTSKAASESFKHYDVHASPTTIVLYVDESGEIKYQEKYEGVLYEFELKLILENFEERAMKAVKGEKVSPPIEKKSSSNVIEDIVLQILRSIFEKGGKEQ